MHVSVQVGTRPHRALNGVAACPHTKPEAVNVQFRKRDNSGDSTKRERSTKLEDGPSNKMQEHLEDVATSSEGGLLNLSSVDKVVHMMRQEWPECQSVDITSHRMAVVSMIAATENDDCRARFVQLGGLPVLDDWLQDVHRAKMDAGAPMEGVYDELTIMLLYALEILPIDLDALKTCMVGKSVNNLRTHKNLEIQKKAKKLVETWKKRVDTEMKVLDEVLPNKHPTLRSRTELKRSHSTTSTRDVQNNGKRKTPCSEQGISTSRGGKDASDGGSHEKASNHQRIIVRLPNPSRSPNRQCATSTVSSLSSSEKQDLSDLKGENAARSLDSCGDVKSSSHDADHSVSGPSFVFEPSAVEHKPQSTCQSNSHSVNVFGSTSIELARGKCSDTNEDAGILSLANIAAYGCTQSQDDSSMDHESALGKGSLQCSDALNQDRGAEEAVEEVYSSQSKMEDKLYLSPEKVSDEKMEMDGPHEGLTVPCSEIGHGCAAGSVEGEGSSSKYRRSLDGDLQGVSFDDQNSIVLSSSLSHVEAKSTDPTSGCKDEDDVMVVVQQVGMDVEHEINGMTNADSSNPCKSELLLLDNAADENSPTNTKDRVPTNMVCVNPATESEQDVVDVSYKAVALAALPGEAEGGDGSKAGDDHSRRPLFDLNEGIMIEESVQEPALRMGTFSGSLAAPVAVVTATKGPFIPFSDLLKSRGGEFSGWKGSAATSAFRPAEPRHLALESFQSLADTRGKRALNIDLNVADESEDMVTSSRMDLDLNKVGEIEECSGLTYGQSTASTTQVRDFDLNDGLDVEGSVEQEPPQCPTLLEFPANSTVLGSSASRTDSSLPLEAFPILKTPPIHTISPFGSVTYRSGPALPSSYPFAPGVPSVLPYGGFPFISGFPYTSAAFSLSSMPATSSSVVIPPFAAASSSVGSAVVPYLRPYVMGASELPATGNTGSYWARPHLDLNGDGSGGFRVLPVNQLSFQQGGLVKRKEPEPYFDPFRSGCRQLA